MWLKTYSLRAILFAMREEEIRIMRQNEGKGALIMAIILLGLLPVLVVACGSLSERGDTETPLERTSSPQEEPQQADLSSPQPGIGGQDQTVNPHTPPPSAESPTVASSPPSTPENAGQSELSSLTLELEIPAEFQVGQPVPLKLKLRNTSQQPVELILGGRPPYDFVVTKQDGIEIWRWSHGQAIQAILEVRTLNPGEELEFTTEWQQLDNAGAPIRPDTYFVRGVLNSDPPQKLETEPKQLIITSP
jgi:hypothetical protein